MRLFFVGSALIAYYYGYYDELQTNAQHVTVLYTDRFYKPMAMRAVGLVVDQL